MRSNQLNFNRQIAEQLFAKAPTEQHPEPVKNLLTTETDNTADEQGSNKYRTIWISDIHLGTPGCQADALLHFLKHNESDTLYLVGDIIDGWQLRKGWFWPQNHNDVIQKVLRKARKGTQVVFIPGNHDEAARQFAGMTFGDIPIMENAVHVTADGKRLWVVHGDEFDQVVRYAKWLAYLGDTLYNFALTLNRMLNNIRIKLGYPYWSLSQFLKHQVKNAVNFILEFEHALIHEAKHRGYDGVVCGHIHKAEIKEVDGLLYCNDGDWVESLTALVEHPCGKLDIVHWPHRELPDRKQKALETAKAE
ncbi:UDP-2,3-diacylglucosamine diphosphatase [Limnobacter sp.]|uniref:UDP-2,3-diacylglucosamine diphosphatase n=1 Tax=Limnobacter sp. TaxID=2003368 RepID=UPI002FE14242